jgi:glutamine synthetase
MAVMNTMMGLQLMAFKKTVDERMQSGMAKEEAVLSVLKDYIVAAKPILFEGNNYSNEWREEAARRGLNNFANTPEALDVLGTDLGKSFYSQAGIMGTDELEAYFAVQLHIYCTKLNIEAKALEEMVHSMVMPAVLRYQTELADNIGAMSDIGMEDAIGYQKDKIKRIVKNTEAIREGLEKLQKAMEKAHHADNVREEAEILCQKVKPQMEHIREAVDELEGIVDDQYWPLVKYRELLSIR